MKLQIDATVVFALTNGNFDLKRKLLLNDLKINHPYNTYKQKAYLQNLFHLLVKKQEYYI